MSEPSEISHPPSPGNSEITLDLEPEPASAGGPQAKADDEPAPRLPGEVIDRPDPQPQARPEPQTFGEIVDGHAEAPAAEANGMARPGSEPPS